MDPEKREVPMVSFHMDMEDSVDIEVDTDLGDLSHVQHQHLHLRPKMEIGFSGLERLKKTELGLLTHLIYYNMV